MTDARAKMRAILAEELLKGDWVAQAQNALDTRAINPKVFTTACALAAMERWGAMQREEWQPIETAPKMKTILLFAVTDQENDGTVRNWRMGTGFYHEGWIGCDDMRDYSPWSWEGDHIPPYGHLPTHWMPLPAAPDIRALRQSAGDK